MAGIDSRQVDGWIELLDKRMTDFQFILVGQASYFESEEVGFVFGHGTISLSDRWPQFSLAIADHRMEVSWHYKSESGVFPETEMAFKLIRKASQKRLNLDVYFSGKSYNERPSLIDGLVPPVRGALIELLSPSYVHTTNMYEKEPYFLWEEGVVVRDRRPWWGNAEQSECNQGVDLNT